MPIQPLIDARPQDERLQEAVLKGLSLEQKRLPAQLLYDQNGAKLYEYITTTPEYYPSSVSREVLRANISDVLSELGPNLLLAELGSGEGLKSEIILNAATQLAAYVPIDIVEKQLVSTTQALAKKFPKLHIAPMAADFMFLRQLPDVKVPYSNTALMVLGATIGNFTESQAVKLLSNMKKAMGTPCSIVLGVLLNADKFYMVRAYNDSKGYTKAFNKNALVHLKHKFNAELDEHGFEHKALYNKQSFRIEMHLVAQSDQIIKMANRVFVVKEGESIITEYSYRYNTARLEELAEASGFVISRQWYDDDHRYSLVLLQAE